jgi:hypothetical protein
VADAIFARVVVPWRMPVESEVPADLRPFWPEHWYGAKMRQGRVIGFPSWMWRWMRRAQGDYLERCFVRDTFRGRPFLRGVACPPGAAPASPARIVVLPDPPPGSQIVRRCGCGRRPPGTT